MVPFRVFDLSQKEMWIVLNYHPGSNGGQYLLALEEDGERDGELQLVSAEQFTKLRLVDFLDEAEDFQH